MSNTNIRCYVSNSVPAYGVAKDQTRGHHYEALWQACAGPLVSVPKPQQLVVYLPQGHIEQISASTLKRLGAADVQLPKHDLPPHIVCRVVDVQLSAEPETDEVKAQLSLLPEPDISVDGNLNCSGATLYGTQAAGSECSDKDDDAASSCTTGNHTKPVVHMFCKTLTASDTSTHGGFSVPRKHAICLPPLDMSHFPPTQELVAKDLHGTEWRFRHIYRGQPKRHLLTTGWSLFVSQKKLVAGDAVIFLRGDDGELRVGIRRAVRPQIKSPSSVLPSQSMHMGVIATATHAIHTRTMFSVYYKPRVSPAEFLIPLEKYRTAISVSLSVGMRFKMKFETEDASERRYSGTITGIEDLDSTRWPASQWRCLKVGWDEPTMFERHDRISPWEMELCLSPSLPPNPIAVGARAKRFCPNASELSSTTDHSLLSSDRNKSSLESMLSANYSATVLQGQEPLSYGGLIDEPFRFGKHFHLHHEQPQQHQLTTPSWPGNNVGEGSAEFPWNGNKPLDAGGGGELLWGISGKESIVGYSFPSLLTSQHQYNQQKFPSADPDMTNPSIPNHSSNARKTLSVGNPNWHPGSLEQNKILNREAPASWLVGSLPSQQNGKTGNDAKFPSSIGLIEKSEKCLPQNILQNHQRQQQPSPSFAQMNWQRPAQKKLENDAKQATMTNENSTGCKLFGFSLTDPNPSSKQTIEREQINADEMPATGISIGSKEPNVVKYSGNVPNPCMSQPAVSKEVNKNQHSVSRSCTKVVKKGSIVGRGVDLSKFDGYDQLFEELERMFHLEGELCKNKRKDISWQVAYSDSEDDILEVGDDPWPEFCSMVKKIYILSREEVSRVQHGANINRHHNTKGQRKHEPTIIIKKSSKRQSSCIDLDADNKGTISVESCST